MKSKIYLQGSSRETDIENRLMDVGREKERMRCMEIIAWKLILPYVKYIAKGNLLYVSGHRGSVSTLKGRMGREMGGRFKGRGYMYTYG